jgi:hypothetical protein
MTPQLECFDCMAAAAGAHHGFRSGCRGCEARGVARGPFFFDAKRAERGTAEGDRMREDYRRILERIGVSHDQVKAAHAADALHTAGGHVPTDAVQTLADSA